MFSAWLVCILTLAMCTAFFIASFSLQTMLVADPAGPALYPRILIVIIGVALAVVLLRLVKFTDYRREFVKIKAFMMLGESASHQDASLARRVAFAMLLSVLYPLVMLKIGFLLSTAVFAFVLMQMFEQKLWVSISLSIGLGVGLHYFFANLLNVRVIPGQWFDLMRMLGP